MLYRFSLLLASILLLSLSALAQDFSVTAPDHVPVILNALNQNNTIKDRIQDQCVIAVLFNPQSDQSEDEKKKLLDAINDNSKIKIFGKKIRSFELPLTPDTNLEKKIIINKINALWLTSDLQSYLENIRESAKYNQVVTISLDNRLVNQSLVALGTQQTETGHKIMVNMSEANNININLNQKLLSEAIVVP